MTACGPDPACGLLLYNLETKNDLYIFQRLQKQNKDDVAGPKCGPPSLK